MIQRQVKLALPPEHWDILDAQKEEKKLNYSEYLRVLVGLHMNMLSFSGRPVDLMEQLQAMNKKYGPNARLKDVMKEELR